MTGISRRRLAAAAAGVLALLAGCAQATPSTPAPSGFPSEILKGGGASGYAPAGTSVIFLVRHGRTDANDQNLVQGWTQTPLNAAGQAQAAAVADALKEVRFSSVLTSDLPRAVQTTDTILAANVQPVAAQAFEELREQNYGGFDGMLDADFFATVIQAMGFPFDPAKTTDPGNFWSNSDAIDWYSKTTAEQRTDGIAAADPTGQAENWATYSVRMQAAAALIEVAASAEEGNTLVVSHGGPIAAMLQLMDPERFDPNADVANGSVSVVYYANGKFEIQAIGIPTS